MAMLTAKQLAAELNRAPKTIRKLARLNRIPGEKTGPGKRDPWLFDLEAVRQRMRQNRPRSIEEQARDWARRNQLKAVGHGR